ncbi:hypothetical protein Btru_014243 [Bulinus truncatus]|nr:hypothetical protein Btru_014243 [Bulinus truncatus]
MTVLGASVLRRVMFDTHSLFLALLAVRVANALLIQTQYVPDEYWQSLEVAHRMVFGYGYLTWEWREGLRGYSYPLIFAISFKVLEILGLDSRIMLIKLPRLLQGAISAYGDFKLYTLSAKLCGRATAQWTLICHLLSWFTIYCCTRTLSNSAETSLVIAALSYFPWPDYPSKPTDVHKFLLLASLSVIVRPTSALVWILLCSWHLQRLRSSPKFAKVCNIYITVGFCTFLASCIVDRIWYGHWTFVQLNFLLFNVIKGGANIYGVHPWHWYISQGFPAILGTFIFPFMLGAYRAKNKALLWLIIWILATHSFLPHKEFRFVMPALPLAMHFCGVYFQMLCSQPSMKQMRNSMKKLQNCRSETSHSPQAVNTFNPVQDLTRENLVKICEEKSSEKKGEDTKTGKATCSELTTEENKQNVTNPENSTKTELLLEQFEGEVLMTVTEKLDKISNSVKTISIEEQTFQEAQRDKLHRYNLTKAKVLISILALTNLAPALYFCLLHQRGTVMVTKYLHEASFSTLDMSVLFLMPCHSTPYYSYIHQNISMRFLTCEPNLLGISNYTEERVTCFAPGSKRMAGKRVFLNPTSVANAHRLL